jgi:DNA-binding transcriptional ArsR family regulator
VPARAGTERRAALSDPQLIKALAHPMRTRILGLLDERIASPRQLSRKLDAPLQNVSYHVRELAKLGLIELVRTTRRRGAIEHHYTAGAAPRVSDEAWSELPPIVRDRMTAAWLSEIFKQVNDAAAGGGFVADDTHLSRTQLVLDDKGRKALAKELEATIQRVDRIHEQARERLGSNPDAEQRMALVMLRFDDAAAPNDDNNKAQTRGRRTTPRPKRSQARTSTSRQRG